MSCESAREINETAIDRVIRSGSIDVFRHSLATFTGGSGAVMLRRSAEPLADDDGLAPIFTHTRELGEKDLHLALALAAHHGIDLPFARLALDHLGAALGVPHHQEHP